MTSVKRNKCCGQSEALVEFNGKNESNNS